MYKRFLSLLLCLVLVLSIPLTVFAEPDQEETEPQQEEVLPRRTLVISDREDFLDFVRACRLDSFSQNLDVTLTADLNLTGADFTPAGIFCGTFDGGGHKISGLEITQEGSVQGLFRYLTQTAEVKNLHIRGEIHPQGSRNTVGALAGSNAGLINGCSFNGSLSGSDYAGGLVGENSLTGVIQNCRVYGEITGNHFVGGIAGINQGVIRDCTNRANINTTPQQNTVDIADVSLQTITGSESANTVTDVGGITGSGSGVIRGCVNEARVGYRQMGYNVGGIAGSFMGYIADCRNEADVSGRKEVGGIVGHMEPVTQVEYEEDALQILDKQLDELSGLTGQVAADARGGASSITSQISRLQGQITDAQKAVQSLIPEVPEQDSDEPQFPQLPDEDTLLAAQNTLSSALSGMQGSLSGIMASTQSTASNLSQDIQAVADQAGKMGQTINEASENLGGSVTDVSDLDTEEDLTGKIQDCSNNGAVLADLNAGGIVGAMGLEGDLDPEEDVISLGDLSLNFEGKLRAVILNCTNYGQITAKKQNGGGIAGWMQLGLVKHSDNFGFVECGDYAGGIAGSSQGYLRYCDVKCRVTGEAYVGGVAGSGAVVSDCRTMVLLEAAEKAGSILGQRTQLREDAAVERNHYLVVGTDLGGIDGISYAGVAQSMDKEEFLSQQDLPRRFQTIAVQFLFEDGKKRTVHLEPGEPLTQEDIPDIPGKGGYQASWEELYMDIRFDTTFRAVYTSLERTVQSNQIWKDGRPVMLIEKVMFQELELTEAESTPVLEEGTVLQAWQFPQVPEGAVLRCLNTEGLEEKQLQMYVLDEQGSWRSVPFTINGSYTVAVANEGDQGVCLVQMPAVYSLWYAVAAVLVVLDAIVIILLVRKKKGKKA